MNTILLYIINSIQDIPANPLPNSAYYIVGKQVVIYDNAGGKSIFLPHTEAESASAISDRLCICEKNIEAITTYLTGIPMFNLGG